MSYRELGGGSGDDLRSDLSPGVYGMVWYGMVWYGSLSQLRHST